MNSSRKRGFTIIELCIVLVVIGLVMGVLLVGQDLLKAARLRSVVKEQESLQTAVSVYKLKYGNLPGDDPNAQSIFGSTACPDPAPGGLNFCNGTGDGYISPDRTVLGRYEYFHVSQHLALAGLIKGNYSGVYNDLPQKICMPSVLENAYWVIRHTDVSETSGIYGQFGHFLGISNISTVDPSFRDGSVLSPIDAFAIDAKIDDGRASTGSVLARDGSEHQPPNLACVTNIYLTSGNYVLTDSNKDCVITFVGAF